MSETNKLSVNQQQLNNFCNKKFGLHLSQHLLHTVSR
jgi:hypothetical protein